MNNTALRRWKRQQKYRYHQILEILARRYDIRRGIPWVKKVFSGDIELKSTHMSAISDMTGINSEEILNDLRIRREKDDQEKH